jgi:hypothetical protein
MRTVGPFALQTCVLPLIVVLTLAWQSIVSADTRTMSAQVAAQFNEGKLEAFAVEDPKDAGRFVAAIFIGGHVLAISAVHPAPVLVRQELAAANHRNVYSILSTSGNRGGRLFVEDFGTPGLSASRDSSGSCDITWRDSAHEVVFDGDWRAQELSEAEYHRRFATDEAEYEEMLRLLNAALSQRTSG